MPSLQPQPPSFLAPSLSPSPSSFLYPSSQRFCSVHHRPPVRHRSPPFATSSLLQILGGSSDSDWFYVGDQDASSCLIPTTNVSLPNSSKNILTPDLQQKIVKQVEYQFSDLSLLANESFQKQINKDPEGYVPITVIASTKKIKSLVTNIHVLTQAIRHSSKLVLSADGKKVKRKHPFTE